MRSTTTPAACKRGTFYGDGVREARKGEAGADQAREYTVRGSSTHTLVTRRWRRRPRAVRTLPRQDGGEASSKMSRVVLQCQPKDPPRAEERRSSKYDVRPSWPLWNGSWTLLCYGLCFRVFAGKRRRAHEAEPKLRNRACQRHRARETGPTGRTKERTLSWPEGFSAQKRRRRYCVFQSLWWPFSVPPPWHSSPRQGSLGRRPRNGPAPTATTKISARERTQQPRDFRDCDGFRNRETGCGDRETLPSRGHAREATKGHRSR